jgi:hypothetical protein
MPGVPPLPDGLARPRFRGKMGICWNGMCKQMGKLMPPPPPVPDEAASEFLPFRSKVGRVQDAELIRQDFIKSQGSPTIPAGAQKPLPKSTKDEC